MATTCLSFSGVIAEDGLDTQELSVGPTAPIAGKADADLSGAPAGSTKITAFDLTITATADMAGGGPALAVAVSKEASLTPLPPGTNPLSGTWTGGVSPGDGQYRTSTVDARYSDNFSAWVATDLGVPTGSDSTDIVEAFGISSNTEFNANELDIRIRARHASWSTEPYGVLVARNASPSANLGGVWAWWIDRSTMVFIGRRASNPSNFIIATVPLSTLGVTNGAWSWLRLTLDTANGVRFWTSTDGTTWTVASTTAVSGDTVTTSSSFNWHIARMFVGNSTDGSSGFGGDISHFSLRDYATGTLLLDLNVTDLTSSIDTTWAATTGHVWLRGSSVVNHGLFAGTETFHFVFDTPTRLDEFRVYVEALHGAVSIDEWCLDYITDDGWSVGSIRWG